MKVGVSLLVVEILPRVIAAEFRSKFGTPPFPFPEPNPELSHYSDHLTSVENLPPRYTLCGRKHKVDEDQTYLVLCSVTSLSWIPLSELRPLKHM